ncbi:amidohydrolase [candidate division KSB1 bacterium]|nr:amidohydrolase [candidate division KSB1 bacterium]
MTKKLSIPIILFLFLSIFWGCAEKYTGPTADLVIKNAKIVTIDRDNPRAEAVAIKGEEIIAVTSNRGINKYIHQDSTQVIDANGRLLIPGFNDAHVHFNSIDPDYIDLRYITDPKIITERVKEKVAEKKPGELIYGGRWEHEMFLYKKWPGKELLDEVTPNNPVRLSRADGHSVLVNSYVIKKSGITKDTPNPFGGEIQHDPKSGEPTGIFKESAIGILKYGIVEKKLTVEEKEIKKMKEWQAAFDKAAKLGVTSIQHPGGGDAELYQKFMDMGKLTLRVDVAGRLTADEEQLQKWDDLRKKYPQDGNWIRFGYLKGFIDGTLGSATMMVFEPFLDEPEKTGLPQMDYEELEQRILASDKMGFQIGIHAIGPKANRWILDAYKKTQQVNGTRDSRHRSEHAQILKQEDIPRFAELGVIASMQPTHCITDKRFCEKRIGKERSKYAYAWRSLLDANAKIAFGTDYPVEPLDPMEGLYAAVTRKDRLGEEGDGWFPEQKLTMEEAIELYTLGAAYAQFMEDRKGIIKNGYLADMVILNNDVMIISENQIMKTKVDYTVVGGKVVFKREGVE